MLVQELIREIGEDFCFIDGFPRSKMDVVQKLSSDSMDDMIIRMLNTDAVKVPNSLEWSSYYSIAKSQSTIDASYEYKIVYGGSCTGMTFSTAQDAVDKIEGASFVEVTRLNSRARFGIQGWVISKKSARGSKKRGRPF